MGIGGGIFLIVVGAILAFAVQDSVEAVDLTAVGYICMAAGALALVISLVISSQRANTTHREVVERHDDTRPAPAGAAPVAAPPVAAAPVAAPPATIPPATIPPATAPPTQP
ncbi:DUF6458 family protein [Pengzhenrongella sicca]|uniref:DUF6458 family protein n=1 Tax=Pengzhenrongella sicca TaxID=2819238 RepID=UPI002221BB15|nr:DUF6458 family protein [Pengzhenrongella sicca]